MADHLVTLLYPQAAGADALGHGELPAAAAGAEGAAAQDRRPRHPEGGARQPQRTGAPGP